MSIYPIPGDCKCWNCQNLLDGWIDLGVDICASISEYLEHDGTLSDLEESLQSWYETTNELIEGKARTYSRAS